jgi:hypothetical protein
LQYSPPIRDSAPKTTGLDLLDMMDGCPTNMAFCAISEFFAEFGGWLLT